MCNFNLIIIVYSHLPALLAAPIQFAYTGTIVTWAVPSTGYYTILAAGAQGGSATDFALTYSQYFLASSVPSTAAVTAWTTFRNSLASPNSFTGFTISSSLGGAITCSDPFVTTKIANALAAGSTVSYICAGSTWHIGFCNGTGSLEFSNAGSCSCNTGFSLRPALGSINWGGGGPSTSGG